MKPTTITIEGSRILVASDYAMREVCKAIPAGRWDRDLRCWAYPLTKAVADAIIAACRSNFGIDPPRELLLAGEAVETSLADVRANPMAHGPTRSLRKAWEHQARGFGMIKALPATMLAWDMGAGKTKPPIDWIAQLDAGTALIVCPSSVVDVWPREFAKDAGPAVDVVALRDGTVKNRLDRASLAVRKAQAMHRTCAVVINYEAVWREPFAAWALGRPWDVVIADECVVEGTMISTPRGDRRIEDIRAGDTVYGMAEGKIVETEVVHTFRRKTSEKMVRIGRLVATETHPVWTANRGYIPAGNLKENLDTVCYIGQNNLAYNTGDQDNDRTDMQEVRHEVPGQEKENVLLEGLQGDSVPAAARAEKNAVQPDMRVVREGVPFREANAERKAAPVLRYELLGEVENVAAGICEDAQHREPNRQEPGEHAEAPQEQESHEEASRLPALRSEPDARPGSPTQGRPGQCGERMARTQRRERNGSDPATEDSGRCAGRSMGDGGSDSEAESGHCPPGDEDRNRGRWGVPHDKEGTGGRPPQGGDLCGDGMGDTPVQERAGADRPCERPRRGTVVHNIETGTSNYFAEGLLVHNCHRLKSPGGVASKFMHRLGKKARRRIGLSGTPMAHSPLDVYAQYRFLDEGIFGTSFTRFRTRYAIMENIRIAGGKLAPVKIAGYQNQEELNRKFYSIADRVTKDEVLDLPPVMHEAIPVHLSPEAMRLYNQMERDMIIDVGNGVVTAANALARLLRLQQITGGAATTEDGELAIVSTDKRQALDDLLTDLPPTEPVVVFCRFRHDLTTVREVAGDLGRDAFEISGHAKEWQEWHDAIDGPNPRGPVLAVQIQAGGLGIDLTAARYCVYYSLGFSLGDYQQSLARTHRPGQTRKVTYLHMIAQGTIDEKVYQTLQERADVVEGVLAMFKNRETQAPCRPGELPAGE